MTTTPAHPAAGSPGNSPAGSPDNWLDRPVFVIGTGRSGLTPMTDMIAYHPVFGWPSQFNAKYPGRTWMSRLSRVVEWPVFRSSLKFSLYPYMPTHDEAWGLWNLHYPGFATPFRDLRADDVTPTARDRFRGAVTTILRNMDKPRFIGEYSGWSRIGFVREIFPNTQFIHIVRDPRATANSLMNVDYWRGYQGIHQWRWGDPGEEYRAILEKYDHSFHALCAIQLKLLLRNLREKTAELPQDDFLLVRYEDLVADPRATARRCLEFLDADPDDPRFLQHLQTTRIVDANAQTFRIPSWRKSFTEAQLAILEELLQEELVEFGYA